MDLYARQQFEFFLQTAVERFVERLEQRFRGASGALTALREDPDQESVWLDGFVDAVFEDFLLNNPDGSTFVLRAMPRRSTPPLEAGTVEKVLGELAQRLFRELLLQKSIEALEQHSSYQPVQGGGS